MSGDWRVFDYDGAKPIDFDAISWACRLTRAMQVAEQFGMFGALLNSSATAADVAAICETDPSATERLLIVLAAGGLLFRLPDERFRLTAQAREAFDPDSPLYYGHGVAHARQSWQRWHHMDEYVRTGEAGGGPPSGDAHRHFVGAMHDYSIRGRVQWLAGNVDLTGRRKLLDLGGGPGTYSIALCQRFEGLSAVVFDQPETEPILRANVAKFGLSARIDFLAGDWTRDDYGTGYDAALMSNVLHGPGRGCEARLTKVFDAMAPGGLLVVQDFLLDDDRNGPLAAAIFNLHVGAYTISEMMEVIEGAGFAEARLRGRGAADNGLVTAMRP